MSIKRIFEAFIDKYCEIVYGIPAVEEPAPELDKWACYEYAEPELFVYRFECVIECPALREQIRNYLIEFEIEYSSYNFSDIQPCFIEFCCMSYSIKELNALFADLKDKFGLDWIHV